jgi:hypothetical protein
MKNFQPPLPSKLIGILSKGGWHPQPIHGQPDAVLSERHLKSLTKNKASQGINKRR